MKMNETTLIYSQPAETLPPIYYMSFDDEDRDVGSLHVEQRTEKNVRKTKQCHAPLPNKGALI